MYKKGGKFYEGWGFSDMVKLLVTGKSIDRNKMFKELKISYPQNQVEKEGDDTVAIYVPDNQISNVKKMAKLFNMKVAYAEGGSFDSDKYAEGGSFGENDDIKYFTYDFVNKGNKWSVGVFWGKFNYITVIKRTNNPFGGKLGKDFPTAEVALEHYKDVNIQANILFAVSEAKKHGYSEKYAWGGLFGGSNTPEYDMAFWLKVETDNGGRLFTYALANNITEAKQKAINKVAPELRDTAKVSEWYNVTNQWKKGELSKSFFADGGEIVNENNMTTNKEGKTGDTIVFRRSYDEVDQAGVIVENLGKSGYDVSSGFSRILVDPTEVISIRPTMTTPRKKFLGLFADGGRTDTRIAETILSQIGGMGRVRMMTGGYNFVALKDGVTFRIKNRRANFIKITLNGRDLYDVEIGRITGDKYKVVKTFNDVYFDQLYDVLYEGTGMYFKLFAKGGTVRSEEKDMILNQLKQVHHHETELRQILETATDIEPWIVAKMERATSNLSDVTHYLDGRTEEYGEGGMFMEDDGTKTYAEMLVNTSKYRLTVMFTWDEADERGEGDSDSDPITVFIEMLESQDVKIMTFDSMKKVREVVQDKFVEKIIDAEKEAKKHGYVPRGEAPSKSKTKQQAPPKTPEFKRAETLVRVMHAYAEASETIAGFVDIFNSAVDKDYYNPEKLNNFINEYRDYLVKHDLYDGYLDFISDNFSDSPIPLYKKGGRTKKPRTAKQVAMDDIRKAYVKINVPYQDQWVYPSEQWNKHALKGDIDIWLESEEELPYISGSALRPYAKGGALNHSETVPSTNELLNIVTRAREKAVKESYKYAKVVVARNDGYYWHEGSSSDGKSELASKPSQRKIREIIKNNPNVTEIGFQGTIKVGDRVGEELEIANDWAVVLWRKTDDLLKIGLNFEFAYNNGKYLTTIVDKSQTETYKDKADNGEYVYLKSVDKKHNTVSENRYKKKILLDEFESGEAFIVDPEGKFAKGGSTWAQDDVLKKRILDKYKGTITSDSLEYILRELPYNYKFETNWLNGNMVFGTLWELQYAQKFLQRNFGIKSTIREKDTFIGTYLQVPSQYVDEPFAKGGRTANDKMEFDVPDKDELDMEMGDDFFADGGRLGKTSLPKELFKIQRETLAQKYWIVKVVVGNEKAKFFFRRMSEVNEFIDTIKHLADEVYVSKEMHYAEGGKIGFSTLSRKVAQRYIGKAVKPKYQSEYGKTYDEAEAKEVGDKVAGKVYWKQKGRK